MKQIVNSIIHIFQNSEKKHIIITGSKGSGKTTLFKKICPYFVKETEGLTSYLKNDCVILESNKTHEKTIVGKRIDGWMTCVEEGFLNLGVFTINQLLETQEEWCSIDEIGFLECDVKNYQEKIIELFDNKRVLCCVRKQDLAFLEVLKKREDVFLWDMDMAKLGCVFMASGLSTRFNGNKLLMEYKGQSFVEHALFACASIPLVKKVLCTRTKALERLENVTVKLHDLSHRNEAVALAMQEMQEVDACIFVPCDQPLLSQKTMELLVQEAMKTKRNIVRIKHKEEVGAPILFKKKYFSMLENLPLKKGGSYLAKIYPEDVSYVEVENAFELFDVDTQADYEKLLKIKSEI